MSWFKVDDAFHASPKVQSIPARQRLAAVGLWTVAGSWCSQQMTDGFVPNYMIEVWKPSRMTVESLVNAGLWDREREGFVFRSWSEYNPTRSQTEAKRAADAERKRAAREKRAKKHAGEDRGESECPPGRGEMSERTPSEPSALSRPDPTRPDPTRPSSPNGEENTLAQPSGSSERDRARRFDEFWSACPRKVGKQKARAKYVAAVKRAGGEQPVIDGMRRLAADPNLPEQQFIPHPTTWLERDGWDDDPLPPRLTTTTANAEPTGYRPEHWRRQPPPEDPGDYVDGEVVDTQELQA
ncbi:hypothetical protein ACT3S7_06215 [Corynebacterium sp. AOP34-AQ2-28]